MPAWTPTSQWPALPSNEFAQRQSDECAGGDEGSAVEAEVTVAVAVVAVVSLAPEVACASLHLAAQRFVWAALRDQIHPSMPKMARNSHSFSEGLGGTCSWVRNLSSAWAFDRS